MSAQAQQVGNYQGECQLVPLNVSEVRALDDEVVDSIEIGLPTLRRVRGVSLISYIPSPLSLA